MESNLLKKSVIEGYGKLAKARNGGFISNLFACCSPSENAKVIANRIGYLIKDIEAAPEASNLGVGCGNPSIHLDIQAGDTVLDLGSGAGFDAFIVSKEVGENGKVIGVDLSEDMLKLANKNARKGGYKNVKFIKGDIEKLPLENDTVDFIISNCVINLSLQKDKVYHEAYRVLKTGGQISISDIVLEKELPEFIRNSTLGHIACVAGAEKIDDYLQYIKNAGFKNIEIIKESVFPFEAMLADPQITRLANEINFDLDSDEAKDIASRVKSISIKAQK